MSVAVFLVIVAIVCGFVNFRRVRKAIERKLDKAFLDDAREDISVFKEYSKESRKKTAEKLKQLKKMKGTYND